MRIILLLLAINSALFGAECKTYFHVVQVVGSKKLANSTTENMRKWWVDKGQEKFPDLCYTDDGAKANYVVMWAAGQEVRSTDIQVPSQSSSTTTGVANGQSVHLNTTTNSTRTETVSNTLTTVAFAVKERLDGPVLFQDDGVGRFRWSHPDQNALEDALKAIQKGFADVKPDNQSGLATR